MGKSKDIYSFFKNRSLKELIEEVQSVYLEDSRPWVIGYSGGKDSTAVVQLIFLALEKLPKEKRNKKVFVISSDTLVETPVIVNHIFENVKKIEAAGKKKDLPIEGHIVQPAVSETFWVNLIGKGYPAPSTQFRWCTDRMKIKPANRFILDKVTEYGEAIVVLGVRKDESATRNQVISFHKIPGQLLSRHSTLPNAYVYSPIVDFSADDVWSFLLQTKSPWGGDNNKLLALYKNASQGECPLVIDTTTPSCGNSRFGCWTCTVVASDKSMSAMIDSGEEWLEPLLKFRELLSRTQDPRNKSKYREHKRRDGKIMLNRDEEKGLVHGPYKFEFRQDLLRQLLEIERNLKDGGHDISLITKEELLEIRRLWMIEQQDWADTVSIIYGEIYEEELGDESKAERVFDGSDLALLKKVSAESEFPWQLVAKLIEIEKQHQGMARRSKIFNELEKVLEEAWDENKLEIERIKKRSRVRDAVLKEGAVSEEVQL